MRNLNCLIIDDEAPARRILEGFLTKIDGIEIAGQAKNAVEAYNILQKNNIDLILLDINMPEINGIELLKMLHVPPVVILTTAYAEYGVESYNYNVADYLLKPIRFERFVLALGKARKIINDQTVAGESKPAKEFFEFKVDRLYKSIPINEILYLQSLGNYIKVVAKKKTYLTMLTTIEAEKNLALANFIRVHKSFIVNIAFIEKYETDRLVVNKTGIPIGKTFRKYLYEKLQDHGFFT